ncbi:hypothetical protein SCHPADRAFT_830184 [Schizopora paradoxa]|uniref:Mini-chromosome maintenance complex-binding protein n=1 Tax=Schizopora paradoxa TaxID=27342 RepID=A0A0H2RJ28_9AGAM|nr:hypothetical protein SCHPADRAFT_830184 [Schizopora paradoxa]
MVSATLIDTISSPADALTNLYDEWRSGSKSVDFADVVSGHFSSILSGDRALSQVPFLSTELIASQANPSRRLVQFPAMVQDTSPSPELYLSRVQGGVRCGGWGLDEGIHSEMDSSTAGSDYSNLRERTVLWAVDIPGIAPWHFVADTPQNTETQNEASGSGEPLMSHKSPFRDASSLVVQVKVYQNSAEHLKPTDLVTFVGLLTSEEKHGGMHDSESSPHEILFPTLHVLFHTHLPKFIVPRNYPLPDFSLSTRDSLINWLADEALQGDRDAAEWILLGCISSVQSRSPPVMPLSITISQFEKDARESVTPLLAHALKQILPLSTFLSLSLERLNSQKFIPESVDEDLHAGFLQLPKGSVLLLSDNEVEEGQLSDKGMRNLVAIQELAKQQTLRYEFPFSNFSFETEVIVIMLTGSRKSAFCETDIIVPLKPTGNSSLYGDHPSLKLPEQPVLNAFRDLICSSRYGKTTVSDKIQADFVAERRQSKSMTSDDLIRRMSVARLLALSHHKQEISDEIWSAAKALDERRMHRCQ